MRINEAAKKLGVSPATVRKAVRDGKLTATKVADPKAWPHGWRWEVDAASVEANQGRWKGRGKYRSQWVLENYPVQTIVVDPNEGVPRVPHGGDVDNGSEPGTTAAAQDRTPWANVALLSLAALPVLGIFVRIRRDIASHATVEPVQPTYVFDPFILQWREGGPEPGPG